MAIWLVLVLVFAGATSLLLLALAALGLWLWEARRRRLDLLAWCRHLCAMVLAMYLGMLLYHGLIRSAVIALGYGAAVAGDLGYIWMITSMAVPMVALMRIEHHGWPMAGEMTLGMVLPVVVCFVLVRLGICPLVPFLAWLSTDNLYSVAHTSMLVGMIVVMVWRRGMYAGVGHRSGQEMPAYAA